MAESNNLIIGKETSKLRLFHPRPSPEPGIALVLFREGQDLITLWPNDQLTSGEMSWGNYKTIYKVDISEHSFDFKCNLPCRGEGYEFHTQVNGTFSVENPSLIIERNVTDGLKVLEPLIIRSMRDESRRYDVEQSAEAETSITLHVLKKSKKFNTGIKLYRLIVKISLEEDARNHIRQLKQIERAKESERMHDELEKQRIELDVERTRMRLDFYEPLIKEGKWQLLALQLANHPDDVTSVAQMIRQQRQSDIDNQLKALKIMLEKDIIEGFQIEEPNKLILERFIESLGADLEVKEISSGEQSKTLEDNHAPDDSNTNNLK